MINGNVNEFIAGLHYGDERFFLFRGKKYFLQGYFKDNTPMLELYILKPSDSDFEWRAFSNDNNYPVSEFENSKIFDGKSFWEIENEIEWLDC